MTKIQSWAIASIGAVALVVGGLLGTGALTSAQSPTPSTATATPAASAPFKSNEDATHEASESAEREAQEDAGQVPTTTNPSATPGQ